MKELTLDAAVENIGAVTDFVEACLQEFHFPMKTRIQLNIAIDEVFSNIAHYAYHPQTGPVTVRIEVQENPLTAVLTFIDHGIPFDPMKSADPDTSLSAEERTIGGLGIYMVKMSMDTVCYEYKDGQNILRIRKTATPSVSMG